MEKFALIIYILNHPYLIILTKARDEAKQKNILIEMTKKILTVTCCIGFIALAFADINGFVDAGRRGLLLFGRNVAPVLFPFFFVSGLLVELDFFSGFKKFGQAAPIFALSLLSGYPTGARLLGELYNRGELTRTQAIKIATYTSTCSPIFIIATLGACFYQSVTIGVLVFLAHSLGALVNGLVYRKARFTDCGARVTSSSALLTTNDISEAISKSLYSAIQNILAVGGLIVVFFVVTNMIGGGLLVSGLLEMTNGVYQASIAAPKSLILPTAIVSFGGLCVCMQGFVFMSSFRMPFWFYLLYKVTHTIFAVAICLLLSVIVV